MRILNLAVFVFLAAACGSSSSSSPTSGSTAVDPVTTAEPAAAPGTRQVTECKECAAGETCVEMVTMTGPKRSCTVTPAACTSGAASCDCMAAACAAPYDTCNVNGAVLTCSCPTC